MRFILIAAIWIFLATPMAKAESLCKDVFYARSELAADLASHFNDHVNLVEQALDKHIALFDQQSGGKGFSPETISALQSISDRTELAAIFEKDAYYRKIQDEGYFKPGKLPHQYALKNPPGTAGTVKLAAEQASDLFVGRFIEVMRAYGSLDFSLLTMRTEFDRSLSSEALKTANLVTQIGNVSSLIRQSQAFRFLNSNRSTSSFWKPIDNVDKLEDYRIHILAQIRNRHGHKLSPEVIHKLASMNATQDPGITTLRKLGRYSAAKASKDETDRLIALRTKLGASPEITPRQLNLIVDRLWIEESYEMTLLALFEGGVENERRFDDITMTREILDLAEALESTQAFAHYVKSLYARNAQALMPRL